MRFLKLLSIVCCLALAGCMTSTKMSHIMDSWHGRQADELIAAWGPATQTITDSQGERIVIYDHSKSIVIPASTSSTPSGGIPPYSTPSGVTSNAFVSTPEATIQSTKVRAFWVDKHGIIYRSQWRGL